MREVLFKAKRIDNGEWVIGHYIPFGLDVDIHYDIDIIFNRGEYIFCSESYQLIGINIKTLCQFTGLKDKYGKMIFENDVVMHCAENKLALVEFINGQFSIQKYGYWLPSSDNFEVIGNKFDELEKWANKKVYWTDDIQGTYTGNSYALCQEKLKQKLNELKEIK